MADKVVGLYGEIGITGIKELKRDLQSLQKELGKTEKAMERKGLQRKIDRKEEGLKRAKASFGERRDSKERLVSKTKRITSRNMLGIRGHDASMEDIINKIGAANKEFLSGNISRSKYLARIETQEERIWEIKQRQLNTDKKIQAEARELVRIKSREISQREKRKSVVRSAHQRFDLQAANGKYDPATLTMFRGKLQSLNKEFRRSGDIARYNLQVTNLMKNFRRASTQSITLGTHLRNLRGTLIGLTGAYTVFAGVASVAEIGKAFESVESSMLAATGSLKEAQAEMKFLRELSRRLGLSVREVSDAYAKLTFSSRGKMSTDEIRNLFTGLSEFGRVMGVSEDRMKFAMMAVQQMANKGTVSMEELKRQLSENLPGSMQVFADAMGVTEAEMIKMVSSGKVLSHEVLPAFGLALQKAARQGGALDAKLKGIRVAEGKMRNDWESFNETVFKSGLGDTLSELYLAIGDLLAGIKPIIAPLVGFLSGFISSLTWVIRLIAAALGDFSDWLGAENIQVLADIGKMLGYVAGLFASVLGLVFKVGGAIFKTVLQPILNIIKFLMPTLKAMGIVQKGSSGARHSIAGGAQYAMRAMSGPNIARIGSAANITGTVVKTDLSLDLTPEAKRILRTDPRRDAARELDRSTK